MPPAVGMAIAGIATAAGSVAGAKMQSGAARRAAEAQTQASNYAADKQDEASRRTEAFQRQQAEQEWANQEAVRRANYDQWVAREHRLGSIAEALGYGSRDVPGYVPSIDPHFDQSSPMTPPPVNTTLPVPNGNTPPVRFVGSGQTPGAAMNGPFTPMSPRDAILARRFPPGSVGAMVLANQRPPAGAGV